VLGTAAALAAIAACVGDDPKPSGGSADDGGGSDSSAAQDGTSGGDSAVADAGADACATADLTKDPRNCGSCSRDCMHGACSAGVCQPWTVATFDGGTPVGPGTDGNHLYYAIDGNVWRVQVDGGAPVRMTSGLDAKAFAKGATGMLACGTLGGNAGVYSLPTLPGASSSLLHDVAACNALVVDGTTVWAGRTASIDEIATAQTSQHVLGPFNERLTGGMGVSGDRLFWVNQNAGVWGVAKASVDAGRAVLNTDAINEANGLTVADGFAYVTARPAGAGGILLRVALDGGASSVLLTSIPQSAFQQGVARAPNGAIYFAAGSNLYGYVPPP